ncbi:glycerophosphoryl diester phosphodiesterase membrane domain-containing protein [Nocardiopsis sp. NPDC058631]|uniref:glycerophosphoryl diester phosphodiesterase membrane domain-containing protein n=1 Tax=Nocardiopsis sp. NPDC058631 TaxID=3346566 RepID=UPI00364C85C0
MVPLRPLTLGDILNGAFSLIRSNPRTTVGLSLIVMAVASIVSSVGFSGYMADYGTFLDQVLTDPVSVDPDSPFPFSAWSIAAVYGGSLLSYAGIILVTGLLTTVIGLAVLGRKLSPSQAWAAVRDRLWSVLGLALLQILISFGLTLVLATVVVGGMVLGFVLIGTGGEGAGIAVVVLSLLLGLGGGIALFAWITIRLYFAMPIVVLERLGPGQALARSWRLTQGSWWRVFGIVLLASMLIGFVSSLLSTPFTLIAVVPSFVFPGEAWAAVVSGAVMFVANVLVYSITTPFTVGVTTLLYVDLRMRREGLDLKLHSAAQAGYEAGPEIYLPEPRA